MNTPAPLIDPFARAISYLRVSVTDRCDFRCVYCMAENMTFLPKKELLTLEELGFGIDIQELDVILKALNIVILFQMNCSKNGIGQIDIQINLKS